MNRLLHICVILFSFQLGFSQLNDHDVYMLANLCDVKDINPVVESLSQTIQSRGLKATIVVNGDMTSRDIGTKTGMAQLDNIKKFIQAFADRLDVGVYLLSGDRDWNDNKIGGYKSVLALEEALEEFIEYNNYDNIKYITEKGCPGPYEIEISRYTTMIVINSQWWNQKHQRPEPADAICKYITNADIMEEIDDIIGENENKNILIAAHHPMRSLGNYGGRFSFGDNMKPFPIIGTFVKSFEANVGGQYDISNERLSEYTELMYNELYFKSNVIYASGHEKNHQIHKEVDNILLNSGAVKKGGYSPSDFSTLLHNKDAGYLRIEYKNTGAVNSTLIPLNKSKEDFKIPLFTSACIPNDEVEKIDENTSYIPCVMNEEVDDQKITSKMATVLPGEGYESGWFKRLMLGTHHRPTWTTHVTVPYLRISQEFRDLDPYEKGGGRQTLSLKFKDEKSKRYTFRSVDKEPRKALNYELRQSIVGRLFEDQTSAQHPFGALPAAALLDHLDILHANPKLYVLPNSEVLGPFQKTYGGMLGMLEENPGKPTEDGTYFADADDIVKSNKLFRELYEDKEHRVATDEFIRARLFDILVGDWSKHEDNWKWAEFKNGDKKIYRPIPRDRDHVFSKWDGLLPWLADREWALPNTEGFDHEIQGFKSGVYQARYLDRFITPEAELVDYLREAQFIQEQLTDERIIQAVKTMPAESYAIEGEVIVEKLIKRRDDLQRYALKYFEWLNEDVEVLGSAKDDYFNIYMDQDSLVIEIWNEKGGEKGDKKLFDRKLHHKETCLVRIYGLGEEDIYNINLGKNPKIDIILLGGEQEDVYKIEQGSAYVEVIDEKENIDSIDLPKREIESTWDRKRYAYNRNSKQFDNYVPLLLLGYNSFNGVSIRASTTWTKHRWDKPDFHSQHSLSISGTTKGDYGLKYNGITRHGLKKWDFVYRLTLANPDFFDSYYGQGNLTKIDPELDAQHYYISTYNNYKLVSGLRRQFWNQSDFEITTGYDFFVNKKLENTILENENELLGANERLSIIPVEFKFNLDFRDDNTFPRNGNKLSLYGYQGIITNKDWQQFGMVGGEIEQYFTTYNYRPFTLGIKAGGMKGLGEVPFYLQPRLGGNNRLRGYTSNRFFGRSSIYFNSELRWRLFKDDDASIPYEFGLSIFYDTGKVSNSDADITGGNKWHYGYGGGIFFVPFDERFTLSLYLTFSEENRLYPQFTIGSALN